MTEQRLREALTEDIRVTREVWDEDELPRGVPKLLRDAEALLAALAAPIAAPADDARDAARSSGRNLGPSMGAGSNGIGGNGAGIMATSTRGESVSKALRDALIETYPQVRARGWRRSVRQAFLMSSRRYGLPRDFAEALAAFRYEPDAYVIDRPQAKVDFFEIEVYNPISPLKLDAYAYFQQVLAYYAIGFSVFAVNSHGHINEVILQSWKRRA